MSLFEKTLLKRRNSFAFEFEAILKTQNLSYIKKVKINHRVVKKL